MEVVVVVFVVCFLCAIYKFSFIHSVIPAVRFIVGILNKRLTQWVEENSIINEAQAGFRRNYSTVAPYLYITFR